MSVALADALTDIERDEAVCMVVRWLLLQSLSMPPGSPAGLPTVLSPASLRSVRVQRRGSRGVGPGHAVLSMG
jgi:hypothetical protein